MTLSPRQRLLRRLRARVKVQRHFDVTAGPDGASEIHTCRTCGTATIERFDLVDPLMMARLTRYRGKGGVMGCCRVCSKTAALERYPE